MPGFACGVIALVLAGLCLTGAMNSSSSTYTAKFRFPGDTIFEEQDIQCQDGKPVDLTGYPTAQVACAEKGDSRSGIHTWAAALAKPAGLRRAGRSSAWADRPARPHGPTSTGPAL